MGENQAQVKLTPPYDEPAPQCAPEDTDECADHLKTPNGIRTADASLMQNRDRGIERHGRVDALLLPILGSVRNIGLVYMGLYAFALAVANTLVKVAANVGLSPWEILLGRSCIVGAYCLFRLAQAGVNPMGKRVTMLHVRGALGMAATVSLYFAVRYLPIADVTVFTFLVPVIVLVASPLVLQEQAGNQALPALLAVSGVVLICQPEIIFGQARLRAVGVAVGCAHALSSAALAAKISLRSLKQERTEVKILYLSLHCVAVCTAVLVMDPSQRTVPNALQAALLLGCGICSIGVQFCLTAGLERVEAAAGMAMTYSGIIWTELIGISMFSEVPNAWAVAGTVVVLCSTWLSGRNQSRRSASATQTVQVHVSGLASHEEPLLGNVHVEDEPCMTGGAMTALSDGQAPGGPGSNGDR